MQTKTTPETDTQSSPQAGAPVEISSFLDTIGPELLSSQGVPSKQYELKAREYDITPSLKVIPGPKYVGGVTIVSTFEEARDELRRRGLPECCVEDRISVANGGPVLCPGH